MAYTHQSRQAGDLLQATEWNAMGQEIQRLDAAKVNRDGNDTIAGPLNIRGDLFMGLPTKGAAVRVYKRQEDGSDVTHGALVLGTDGEGSASLRLGYNAGYSWLQSRGKQTLSLNPRGGDVGVGVDAPQDRLHVAGGLRILEGSNPVRFTSRWSGFPDAVLNQAEISNDTADYKTLMVVGNRSGDGKTRRVSVWDRLEVNGSLRVSGGADVAGGVRVTAGAIVPSAGNAENAGIMFPKDAAGGSGDAAWMRYYASAGEQMVLELGTTNDPDDHLALMPSGNVGIGTRAPSHKLHVVAADAVGLLESSGPQAFLRLSTREGLNNRIELCNRPGGRLALWTAGGGDVLNIERTGQVGIGTTSPQATLHVNGDLVLGEGNNQRFIFHSRTNANGDALYFGPDNAAGAWDWGRGMVYRRANATFEIPGGTLSFGAQTRQMINLWSDNYGIGVQGYTQYYRTDKNFAWYQKGAHRDGELDPGGGRTLMTMNDFACTIHIADFLIGHPGRRKSPGRALVDVTDKLGMNWDNDWPNGIVYHGNFTRASSREYKDDIAELEAREAREVLEGLTPVEFTLRKDEEKKRYLGFIAEEVPALVGAADRKSVNDSHILAVLTRVVKEQQRQIDHLLATR